MLGVTRTNAAFARVAWLETKNRLTFGCVHANRIEFQNVSHIHIVSQSYVSQLQSAPVKKLLGHDRPHLKKKQSNASGLEKVQN